MAECSTFVILYNIHTNVVLARGICLFKVAAVDYTEDSTIDDLYLRHAHVPLTPGLANDYTASQ